MTEWLAEIALGSGLGIRTVTLPLDFATVGVCFDEDVHELLLVGCASERNYNAPWRTTRKFEVCVSGPMQGRGLSRYVGSARAELLSLSGHYENVHVFEIVEWLELRKLDKPDAES